MIEVEVKLKINDRKMLSEALIKDGFKKEKTVKETDFYFNGNDHDFRKTDEALRIRRTEMLDGDFEVISTLTYKGPKLDKTSMTREEIELKIDDFDGMEKILIHLGYKKVIPVIKTRTYYICETMTALIDNVEGLGDYLELEILVEDKTHKEAALQKIEDMLNILGYSMSDTTTISYLSMLQSKT